MFVAIYKNEFLETINLDIMEKMNPDLEDESNIIDLRYFKEMELNLAISHLRDILDKDNDFLIPSMAMDVRENPDSIQFVGKLVIRLFEANIQFTKYND